MVDLLELNKCYFLFLIIASSLTNTILFKRYRRVIQLTSLFILTGVYDLSISSYNSDSPLVCGIFIEMKCQDNLFGMGNFNYIMLVYWLLLSLYIAYIMITCILLVYMRNDYILEKRGVGIICLCAFLNLIAAAVIITHQIYYGDYPCFLYLWGYAFILPAFAISNLILRGLILLRNYTSHQSKLNQVISFKSQFNDDSNFRSSSNSPDSNLSHRPVSILSVVLSCHSEESTIHNTFPYLCLNPTKECIFSMIKYIFTCSFLSLSYRTHNGPFVTSIILSLFHFITCMYFQLSDERFSISPMYSGLCDENTRLYPLYACFAFYGFAICPLLLWRLNTVSDAYRIKSDILIELIIGSPFYALFLMWTHADFMSSARKIFPASLILFFALLSAHTLITVLPLVGAIRRKHNSIKKLHLSDEEVSRYPHLPSRKGHHSRPSNVSIISNIDIALDNSIVSASLEQILENPILCAKFKKFTISEFAIENLLFYEAYIAFKQLFKPNNENENKFGSSNMNMFDFLGYDSKIILKDPIIAIYSKFIKQGSLYEVNINGSTRKLMEEWLNQGRFASDFFDLAFEEVYHLLVSWSLPRFLRKLNQSMEFRTSQ